jgi:hypothetical protein
MLAAKIADRNAGLMLLQNSDDLLFRKANALHALVLVMGQSEQPGLSPRGNVSPEIAESCERGWDRPRAEACAVVARRVLFQENVSSSPRPLGHYY